MPRDPQGLAEFRERLKRSREQVPAAWESSRSLVGQPNVASTLKRLAASIQSSSLPLPLKDAVLAGIRGGEVDRIQDLPGESLKQLTGLPATKAVRALCVEFGLAEGGPPAAPIEALSPAEVEQLIRKTRNPFDLLLAADVASVLDLGAGDLSFASELVEQYLPRLREQGKELTVHCVDRLRPGSKLGGLLHADPGRLERFRTAWSSGLHFRFWSDQDMFKLDRLEHIWPCYTLVTCHAPATPAFAYEPTRISRSMIEAHLTKTKGQFRRIRLEGEEALEVRHGGRQLLFPPWKFDIRGPLVLLDLMSRQGKLAVLAAVDAEVFWELLSQLLADVRVRPPDVVFDSPTVTELFGPVGAQLSALRVGEALVLSDQAEVRGEMPRVLGDDGASGGGYRFRYVEVRRGATFEGLPASSTARLFRDMAEEVPPWLIILVPELC
ncbi:MAG: hypothetical protein ACREIS_09370 [Nitrospiraceae bacterium]